LTLIQWRPDLLERLRALPAAGALVAALPAGDAEVDPVHLVGGAVRDLLRGEEPVDLDLVVEGEVAKLARRIAERVGGTVRVHERFGTAVRSSTSRARGASATSSPARYPTCGPRRSPRT